MTAPAEPFSFPFNSHNFRGCNDILLHVLGKQIQISDDSMVTFKDASIERDIKAWLGKTEQLTLQDIQSLKKYTRYRSISPEVRKKIRAELCNTLSPLLQGKKEVTIPCMKGYDGTDICLSSWENNAVIIKALNPENDVGHWTLTLQQDGSCIYRDQYITLKNEDHATIAAQPNYILQTDQPGLNGQWVFNTVEEKDPSQVARTEPLLNRGPAHMELIIFKWDQIISFLEGTSQHKASQTFDSIIQLLTDLSTASQESGRNNEALVESKGGTTTTYKVGPIWSPQAASQDSAFNWMFTQTSNQKNLVFEKISTGRGVAGGTSERIVTFKTLENDTLEVEILKVNATDLEINRSSSVYRLQKKEGQIQVIPQGMEKESNQVAFILGMEPHQGHSNAPQSNKEIKEDHDFILTVLTTIDDIKRSPDTMIIDKKNNRAVTLSGATVPADRLKLLDTQRQGICGCPSIFLDSRNGKLMSTIEFVTLYPSANSQPITSDK